ncbi:MAG: anti-sigma factor family protein [Bacillota bacterium]
MDSIDCNQCTERIDEYFDGMLDADTQARFEAHVKNCEACAAQLEARRMLMDEMKRFRTQYEPPADFHARWVQAVQRERLKSKRMRFRTAMASAAAVMVLLLGIGVFIGLGKGTGPQEIASIDSTAQSADSESAMFSRLETVNPDVNTRDVSLQATAAVGDNGLFADSVKGDSGGDASDSMRNAQTEGTREPDASSDAAVKAAGNNKTMVLQAEEPQKAIDELLSLTDRNGISVQQTAAGTYTLEINPVSRPVIAPWLSEYTDETLPQDETFILQITVEQK